MNYVMWKLTQRDLILKRSYTMMKIFDLIRQPLRLKGYSYYLEEVVEARNNNNILCMRLDTNYNCNLKCAYCYSYSDEKVKSPAMPLEDVKNIINQACELGLRSIVYLGGGEPTLYPDFLKLVEYMASKDVTPVIFTNGMLVDKSIAGNLFDLGASVIVKFDGFEETQDKLTGEGTYKLIHRGLERLMEAGFAEKSGDNYTRLGLAPCLCSVNYNEIPEIWRYARRNNIFPDIEKATVVGNATQDLSVTYEQVCKLTAELMKIDQNEFGLSWELPYSSIIGHSCYIYLTGIHVTAHQEVAVCPEIPPVASLKVKSLAQILNSEPFTKTRHIEKFIVGECSKCDYLIKCFGGCRSKAYYRTGSFFGSDPFCTLINEFELKEEDCACTVKK
jgi:radical SAM protein with 4Fe4S-binding SPASM domain